MNHLHEIHERLYGLQGQTHALLMFCVALARTHQDPPALLKEWEALLSQPRDSGSNSPQLQKDREDTISHLTMALKGAERQP